MDHAAAYSKYVKYCREVAEIEPMSMESSEQKVEALILHASCVSEAVKIFHKLFPDHHFVSATESQERLTVYV